METNEKERFHPITWVEGENMCRWRGMHEDEYSKLMGEFEGDCYEEGENWALVGGVLYVDPPVDLPEGLEISSVRSLKDMDKKAFGYYKQFCDDIEDYYNRLHSGNWDDLNNIPKIFN